MKKVIAVLLALAMLCLCAACGEVGPDSAPDVSTPAPAETPEPTPV